MKKLITLLSVVLSTMIVEAQPWTTLGCNENTNTNITQTAATVSYSAVGADGTHYIAYIDDMGGPNNVTDFCIHVKKFNGTQWVDVGGAATPQFPSSDFFPIAIHGNELYLAYTEPFGSGFDSKVTVKKFSTSNNQWELVGSRGLSTGAAGSVGLKATANKIYVAYADDAFSNKVSVKVFDKNNTAAGWQLLGSEGISEGEAVQLPGSGVQVKVSGDDVYINYIDISLNTAGGLVVKKFNGTAWTLVGGEPVSGTNPGYSADMDFDNTGKPYISFFEPNAQQAIVRTLVGNTWSTVGGQAVANTITGPVSMVVMNNKPYIAYAPAASIVNAEVKVFNALNGNWEFAGTNPATNVAATSDVIDINLVASGNTLHLNFHTSSTGLYVKTWTNTTLPLQLISFSGILRNNSALLSWQTANEVNTSSFEIEQQNNMGHFAKIGTLASSGKPESEYSFTSSSLATGKYFFRLKMIDKDGSVSYSHVVVLNVAGNKEQVVLYPNPAKDILKLEIGHSNYKEAVISDLNGKIISKSNLSNSTPVISIASLAAGRYFLTLYSNEERINLSFIKQ